MIVWFDKMEHDAFNSFLEVFTKNFQSVIFLGHNFDKDVNLI